jgi:hypothetical protein
MPTAWKRLTMGQALRGVLIATATILIAGCGSSSSTTPASSSTTPASSSTTPARLTHAQAALCKDFGGVSPSQRGVTRILTNGVRCKGGIVTDGTATISRPAGGWKTLIP